VPVTVHGVQVPPVGPQNWFDTGEWQAPLPSQHPLGQGFAGPQAAMHWPFTGGSPLAVQMHWPPWQVAPPGHAKQVVPLVPQRSAVSLA
jgi:hypothetical protein